LPTSCRPQVFAQLLLDIVSGRREVVVEIQPHDWAGVHGLECVSLTPDGTSRAYHYTQFLSDPYLVDGLR
jgi:hypothetical protein